MSKEIVRLYNYLERVDYLEDVLPNNPTTLELINSFFLNQQFITQGAVADHGSYNVTTYIRTKEKKRKEKKEKDRGKGKEKGKTHQVKSRTNHCDTFVEGESSKIILQEHNEMT